MMTLEEIVMIFHRREKCFMQATGHNADASYVVSQNGTYVTTCGDHLTRGIRQIMSQNGGANGKIDVRVWVKP